MADGDLWCWGIGMHGQLGLGDKRRGPEYYPQLVTVQEHDSLIRAFATGAAAAVTAQSSEATAADLQTHQLYFRNQLQSSSAPDPRGRVSLVACGAHHTAACTWSGEVLSWGCSSEGQLGHGDTNSCFLPKAVEALQRESVGKVVCVKCMCSILGDFRGMPTANAEGWIESAPFPMLPSDSI